MEPICRMALSISKNEKEVYQNLIEKVKVVLTQEDKKL